MKSLAFGCILLAINITSGYSQNPDENMKSLDIRLWYGITSLGERGNHFEKHQSLIPYGAGISLTLDPGNRFTYDFGVTLGSMGKWDWEGWWSHTSFGPTYTELGEHYLSFPIHINFKLLDSKQ